MSVHTSRSRVGALLATVLSLLLVLAGVVTPRASADTAPPDTSLPKTVSVDALPTVQVDGVVQSQVIAGNTVFAGGDFAYARPAAAKAGESQTRRWNLLSYNLQTGVLIDSFAPELDSSVKSMAVSPDQKTLYVVGSFTKVGSATRNRVAAFDVATGALTAFAPSANLTVLGVSATETTVYLGGSFNNLKKKSSDDLVYVRPGAAAVNAATGDILAFDPVAANGSVRQLIVSPDRSKVILGGNFTTLNNSSNPGYGLGAVSASTGDNLALPVNALIRNAGENAAIMSLVAGPDGFYGSGYAFSKADGNLEGAFKADWTTGNLVWVEDCHGDTYSVAPVGGAVYVAGHPHYCGNIGGFPQTDPDWTYHRVLAFSDKATGVIGKDPYGYFNFEGKPRPTLLDWFPDTDTGTATGKTQGPWHVTGNGDYVVYGGEFKNVNAKPQQGIVRFARVGVTGNPNKTGGQLGDDKTGLKIRAYPQGLRLSWPANWDKDNERLTYTLTRTGTSTPVFTAATNSTFWQRPNMSYFDTSVVPGTTYTYKLKVADPYGNTRTSTSVSAAATGGTALSTYDRAVLDSSPTSYWPLDEKSGSTAGDLSGSDVATSTTVTKGVPGAIAGDPGTGYRFAGSTSSYVAGQAKSLGPDSFSTEAWFRTTTTTGGSIIGFGSAATGSSGSSDRKLYLSPTGKVYFGVRPVGVSKTISSPGGGFNNGQWHHVVGTFSPQSMNLYVDGALVSARTDVLAAQQLGGYWRIGGDTTSGWPDNPSTGYLAGDLDQVAVYNEPITPATVQAHYALRTGPGGPANVAPTASFTSTTGNLTVSVNGSGSSDSDGTVSSFAWDFGDGATGTGATASHPYTTAGTYPVKLTVTDDDGATGTVTHPVTVTAAPTSPAFVVDEFERTVASGLGTADTGGAWTTSNSTGFSVSGGAGVFTLASPGTTRSAYLGSTLRDSSDISLTYGSDKAATGSGTYLKVSGRRISSTLDYRAEVVTSSSGKVVLSLSALQGSSTSVPMGSPVTLPGTLPAGGQVTVRMQTYQSAGGTTTVRARAWWGTSTEPSTWQASATNTYPALQAPGAVGLTAYLSSSATNAPVKLSFSRISAKPVTP